MHKTEHPAITKMKQRILDHNSSMNALTSFVQNIYGTGDVNRSCDTLINPSMKPSSSEVSLEALSLGKIEGEVKGIMEEVGKGKTDKEINDAYQEEVEEQAIVMAGSIGPTKLSGSVQFLEKMRLKKNASISSSEDFSESNLEPIANISVPASDLITISVPMDSPGKFESFSINVVLNEQQQNAAELAMTGASFVLTGPAGTGKTTTQRAVADAVLQDKRLGTSSFKSYNEMGYKTYISAPSIAFCAFTKRAARNLEKAIFKLPSLKAALKCNVMTIHTLLEYEPETYFDAILMKERFRFSPRKTASNPLDITHLVIEESSMLGLDLWEKLYEALPYGVQIIFIGDINQLPPVFGPSILNYALVQLPIIELTQVYRNQGIVLENAHNVLNGRKLREDKDFVIVRGSRPVQYGQEQMARQFGQVGGFFDQLSNRIGDDGLPEYDPEDCIVLSSYNEQPLGTKNINNWIAQRLGEKRGAIVHEIIAGFEKHYIAVGDKVMFNKRDAIVLNLFRNPNYYGKTPQLPGKDLTRFGHRILGAADVEEMNKELSDSKAKASAIGIDYSNFSLEEEKMERKTQASHQVILAYEDGTEETLAATGDFGKAVFSLGYCLTVHKAQGSEWRKVFFILHKEHATMHFREHFYTAITRARTKVTIIGKDFVINKIIAVPRIKGNSLKDKLEYFNSGVDMNFDIRCTKI